MVKKKESEEKEVKKVVKKIDSEKIPDPVDDLAEKSKQAKKDLEKDYKGKDMTHNKDIIYKGKIYRKGEILPPEVKDFLIKAGG